MHLTDDNFQFRSVPSLSHVWLFVTPWPMMPCRSGRNCCFLTCIQISQDSGQVVWYSQLFQNFPQFIVIHTVRGFGIANKREIDVFSITLAFWWSSGCWKFDLWFLCLFENQLEHLEVHASRIVEAWLAEFGALFTSTLSVFVW